MANTKQGVNAMDTLRVKVRSLFDKKSTELSKRWQGYSQSEQLDQEILDELRYGLGKRYRDLQEASDEEEIRRIMADFMTWTSILSNKMDQKIDPAYFEKEEELRRELAQLEDLPESEPKRLALLQELENAFFIHQTRLSTLGLRGFALPEPVYQEAVTRLEENRERCHLQVMNAASIKEVHKALFAFTSEEIEIRKWAATDAVRETRKRAKTYVTAAQRNVFDMTLNS